jgi:hypothetical protein
MPTASFVATLLAFAALPHTTIIRQPPESCANVMGHLISTDHARTTVVLSERGRCLEVRIAGRVTFTDDDADVRSLEPGGSLVATEARDGERRTMSLVERGGAIEREYRVNGAVRPAADGAEWFGRVVLDLLRESGFGAAERVARIRRQRGVSGVLDEVGRLRSDHVRGIYLHQLLASGGLSVDELRRVVRTATDDIASDHERTTLLLAALERHGESREVTDEVLRGAAAIGSDHERANVLTAAVDRGAPEAAAVRPTFFRAVDGIGSDHERRRVLEPLAGRDSLGAETLRALLASASRLGSDHEKAAVLLAVAWRPERLRDASTRAAFDAALRSIGSDAEYRRVANVLAR